MYETDFPLGGILSLEAEPYPPLYEAPGDEGLEIAGEVGSASASVGVLVAEIMGPLLSAISNYMVDNGMGGYVDISVTANFEGEV